MSKDEITIKELVLQITKHFRTLLLKWKVITISGLSFAVFGGILSFIVPEEYRSEIVLLPNQGEEVGGNLGGLSSLAGLAGINLNSGVGMDPNLFPKILEGDRFLFDLANEPLEFSSFDQKVSFIDFFENEYQLSISERIVNFPTKILSRLRSNNVSTSVYSDTSPYFMLSRSQEIIIEDLAKRVEIIVNQKSFLIDIKVSMPDPIAAASLAKLVTNNLTEKIIELKISKSNEKLIFLNERYSEVLRNYQMAQLSLANFIDNNKNITSAVAEVERQRLQNEFNTAYEVYNSIVKQMEETKILVKDNTPVFTVLDPIQIPNSRYRPRRALYVILYGLIGGLFSVFFILTQAWWRHNISG